MTGAGKTEMIYKIVAYVLENKNRVAIASPRVDVCRELFSTYAERFYYVVFLCFMLIVNHMMVVRS